jgi:hypothetical protein
MAIKIELVDAYVMVTTNYNDITMSYYYPNGDLAYTLTFDSWNSHTLQAGLLGDFVNYGHTISTKKPIFTKSEGVWVVVCDDGERVEFSNREVFRLIMANTSNDLGDIWI